MSKKITKIIIAIILLTSSLQTFAIEDKKAKENEKYSRYIIPTTTIMPDDIEPDKLTIEGNVSKSLELNLADCLELALRHNPRIKAQYAKAAAQKTLKGQALSNYSPRVDAKIGFSRMKPDYSTSLTDIDADPLTNYTIGEIGVKQLIYDFGITQNLYHMRKIEYEASLNEIESVVNEIICEVKKSYYMLVTSIEQRRVMEDTVNRFEQTYAQALAFYEVGMKPKIDVTIAATNLADAKASLIRAKNLVEVSTADLNNVMGLPFIAEYSIEEVLPYEELDVDMKQLIEIANENRPALKNAILNVKDMEQAWKLSKKAFLPPLEFQGKVGSAGNNERSAQAYWNFGGYLQFSAVNPLLVKNQIDERRHLYEAQQFTSDSTVNDIYFEIQKTWSNLKDAKDRVPVALLSMNKAKENYELAYGRYKVGESDAIELKDAQIQYQDSRLAYYNTLFDYNKEKSNLEKAIGQTLKSKPVGIENIKLKETLYEDKKSNNTSEDNKAEK